MLNTRDAMQVLDHDFLETRAKLLEVAAILDRIDRAPARHGEHPDVRMYQLRRAVEALLSPGRAGPRPFSGFFHSTMIRAGVNG